MSMDQPPIIRTLLCHAHVPMALRCLGSLVRFHRGPFRLCIHDDGTLTDQDIERLAATAPDATFVRRPEADAAVLPALSKFPACLAYRQAQALGLKLFDLALLSGGATVRFCDSDILFLRPFHGLCAGPAAAPWPPLVLMRDLFNTYSLGWRRLLAYDHLPLVDRANSGIFVLDPAVLDLDFVEWFLRRPEAGDLPNFAEQTAWSALMRRVGGVLFNRRTFGFPTLDATAPPPVARRPVAWHFVGLLRGRFDAVAAALAADGEADALPPVTLEVFRPAVLNFPRYCVSRWQKGRLARQLAREEAAA